MGVELLVFRDLLKHSILCIWSSYTLLFAMLMVVHEYGLIFFPVSCRHVKKRVLGKINRILGCAIAMPCLYRLIWGKTSL